MSYIEIYDKVRQRLVAGRWFSPVSSTNKTDIHDITEILLKVALITKTLTLYWDISMKLGRTALDT